MRTMIVAVLSAAALTASLASASACPFATKDTTAQTPLPASPVTTAQVPAPVKQ